MTNLATAIFAGFMIGYLSAPVQAALVGTINGTVTDATTNAPLANVRVTAVAPTQRATAVTDARGFFSLTGVQPDTYTLSFERAGYEPHTVAGVSVNAEQIQTVSQNLSRKLKEIGRVSARSSGSAFQPNQTTDTYTVTSAQIDTIQGKANANDEITLVGSLPGAEIDASGYPSLRGGRANEVGYEYEGINYSEPYANEFANSLLTNGIASLQLSPGAGDASQGNSGSGVVNLIAKRGTYPAFGQVAVELAGETYWHDFIAEYGVATQDGTLSNYFKFIGQRQAELYGNRNQSLEQINEYNGNRFNVINDYVDNLVFRFGAHKNKSLQLFYQGIVVQYQAGAAIPLSGDSYYRTGQPAANERLAQLFSLSGDTFTAAQVGSLRALYPGQTGQNETLDRLPAQNQPLQAFKLQYGDNPDASSYFEVHFSRLSQSTTFDFPTTLPAPASFTDFQILQGGLRTTGGFDYNRQLSRNNLVSIGARYDFDQPVYSAESPAYGLFTVQGLGERGGFLSTGRGFEILDFLPEGATCPANTGGLGKCGFLSRYFSAGVPRVPPFVTYEPYIRQEYGVYAKDDMHLGERFRASLGLRVDGSNIPFGNLEQQFGLSNGDDAQVRPRILQPRFGVSYQLSQDDSASASFGRSSQNPYFSSMVGLVNPAFFAPFLKVPAYDNLTGSKGAAVKFCGLQANQPCTSYADQLFWEYQNALGPPVFPLKPEQFSNIDVSYAHQFGGDISMKITPYYRSGQDIVVTTSPLIGYINHFPVFGPYSSTNLGVSKTSGVEFLLTKDAKYGFSGTLTGTYVNELTNVPPLQTNEDFFPSVPPASLALGKLYRVGFLSPFEGQLSLQYQSHGGWRINPTAFYVRGFPYNQGSLTAYELPNGRFANVPNTNLTSPVGAALTPCYVDPGNPGTYQHPLYVACRGPAESADPGGLITPGRFNTDLTIEYTPRRSRNTFHRAVTFGVQVLGLFNSLYGYPTLNDCYQPVATGVSGPLSGYGLCAYSVDPYGNGHNAYVNIRGNQPYLLIPNNNYASTAQTAQAPRLTLFYMQVKL